MYCLYIFLQAKSSRAWAEGSCGRSLHTCLSHSPSHFLNNWDRGRGLKKMIDLTEKLQSLPLADERPRQPLPG